MKVTNTSYLSKKEILKFSDHYVSIGVTIDDTGVTLNSEGKKIVPAGTIMGGGFLSDKTKKAIKTNAAGAEGVLFYDVDVSNGPVAGAIIIHGFINKEKLPETPDSAAITALKQIQFL